MSILKNAPSPQRIPTYDGSDQSTHPSVIRFDTPWNGYLYWMAMTPYPYNNDGLEDPSIVVSNDGKTWAPPKGLMNPLTSAPERGHNCDVELVYNRNCNELWLYYVEADDIVQSWVKLMRSSDGIEWTRPETVLHDPVRKYSILSPCILPLREGTWRMWYVDTGDTGYQNQDNKVRTRTSEDGLNWSGEETCSDLVQSGYQIWHLTVLEESENNTLHAVYPAYPNGTNCDYCKLFYAVKEGNGPWKTFSKPLMEQGEEGKWDDFCLYRTAFLLDRRNDLLRVWYGGKKKADDSWGIGYTEGEYSRICDELGMKKDGDLMTMSEDLLALLSAFRLDSEPLFCEPYGCGHIHDSFLAGVSGGRRYILQKINRKVFPDVGKLMENITAVTEFLEQRRKDPARVLSLVRTSEGESFLERGQSCWRLYEFVEGTICLQYPESDEDFYQSAVGFGNFLEMLSDFPVERLHETIPGFHDTPERFEAFLDILARDPLNRASLAEKEIGFVLDRSSEMDTLTGALNRGDIPLRVTHNDTKLNNVLLDAETRKSCCVIDLDTVMPGSSLYDFGDAIRFGAATAAEDEKDLSRMELSLDRFRVFTRGYSRALSSLTDNEIMLLSSGAKIMTLECGMRFLADYLEGDRYFSTHRENHNLDRARTQFKLVADMERKWDDMQRIVKEETVQSEWD